MEMSIILRTDGFDHEEIVIVSLKIFSVKIIAELKVIECDGYMCHDRTSVQSDNFQIIVIQTRETTRKIIHG